MLKIQTVGACCRFVCARSVCGAAPSAHMARGHRGNINSFYSILPDAWLMAA